MYEQRSEQWRVKRCVNLAVATHVQVFKAFCGVFDTRKWRILSNISDNFDLSATH